MAQNTKLVGDIAEATVALAFLRGGFPVLWPFGENQRYDLVVEIRGRFFRVQCKNGRVIGGAIVFNASSVIVTPKGWSSRPYRGDADLFGVHCPQTDGVYLVPVDAVGTTQVSLRLTEPKNGRRRGVRMAADYEFARWMRVACAL
jgi:hypothetical protein